MFAIGSRNSRDLVLGLAAGVGTGTGDWDGQKLSNSTFRIFIKFDKE